LHVPDSSKWGYMKSPQLCKEMLCITHHWVHKRIQ
jgi:hypothetical protein